VHVVAPAPAQPVQALSPWPWQPAQPAGAAPPHSVHASRPAPLQRAQPPRRVPPQAAQSGSSVAALTGAAPVTSAAAAAKPPSAMAERREASSSAQSFCIARVMIFPLRRWRVAPDTTAMVQTPQLKAQGDVGGGEITPSAAAAVLLGATVFAAAGIGATGRGAGGTRKATA